MSANQNEVFFLDSDPGLYASYTYLDPEYIPKQQVSHQILVYISSWTLYNAKCRNEWLEGVLKLWVGFEFSVLLGSNEFYCVWLNFIWKLPHYDMNKFEYIYSAITLILRTCHRIKGSGKYLCFIKDRPWLPFS